MCFGMTSKIFCLILRLLTQLWGTGNPEEVRNMTRYSPPAKLGYLGYNIAAPT